MLALLTIPFLVSTAAAGPTGGGKQGGGGALSRVSAGIGSASRASGSGMTRGSGTTDAPSRREHLGSCYDRDGSVVLDCANATGSVVMVRRRARQVIPSKGTPQVDFYAGVQKVHDSDGSASIELAVTDERFRIAGSFSRYLERLDGGGALTMTMPTLMGGIRIDDMGATRVFLEGGVVHARTNGDVMGDSKLTGPIAGLRVEHALADGVSLIGAVQQMWFDDGIRATAGHAGIRYGHAQASFRVLDFNVGPPLFGPEVGIGF